MSDVIKFITCKTFSNSLCRTMYCDTHVRRSQIHCVELCIVIRM